MVFLRSVARRAAIQVALSSFCSLLSGVHFLHERRVMHNDIKPANILLSHKSTPVLVDFGFAEKYDLSSPKAFHIISLHNALVAFPMTPASLTYGHSFFEILVGRTPFEYEEGEQFASKADLEKYWGRTMGGKWAGSYTIRRPAEKLLKRMIVPNADLRCTAEQAMADLYWQAAAATAVLDKHALNTSTPQDAVPKDASASQLFDISLPWSSNSRSPSHSSASHPVSRTPEKEIQEDTRAGDRYHARSKSQPKLRSPYPHADGYTVLNLSGMTNPTSSTVGKGSHDMKTGEMDSEIDPDVTSYRADLSAGHIEIARTGVRASAQLLTMSKGSISVLGVDRSYSTLTAPAVCNLPSEMPRASESGFVGLKHSVKASIDKSNQNLMGAVFLLSSFDERDVLALQATTPRSSTDGLLHMSSLDTG
ncbi:kinase-like domain-containing protein [Suillus cothurnatus]|nr:kinase-like domain-containing protein [Suillus cothurnatus]